MNKYEMAEFVSTRVNMVKKVSFSHGGYVCIQMKDNKSISTTQSKGTK